MPPRAQKRQSDRLFNGCGIIIYLTQSPIKKPLQIIAGVFGGLLSVKPGFSF